MSAEKDEKKSEQEREREKTDEMMVIRLLKLEGAVRTSALIIFIKHNFIAVSHRSVQYSVNLLMPIILLITVIYGDLSIYLMVIHCLYFSFIQWLFRSSSASTQITVFISLLSVSHEALCGLFPSSSYC